MTRLEFYVKWGIQASYALFDDLMRTLTFDPQMKLGPPPEPEKTRTQPANPRPRS